MTVSEPGSSDKIAIWRDERFWKIAFQVITLAVVIAVLSILITNFNRNLAQQGTTFGFSFLENSAGFGIGENLVDYQPQDSYLTVLWAGLKNSLRMIVVGIVLATVVGILAGVASFSDNWLVYKISRAYVGLVRNVPLLLQLFVWYFAVFVQLPTPQDQINIFGLIFLSKRGVYLPGPSLTEQNWRGLVTLVAALFLCGLLWKLIDGAWARGRVWASPLSRIINGIFAIPVFAAIAFLIFYGIKWLISDESADGFSLGAGIWIPFIVIGLIIAFFISQQRTKVMVEQGASGKPQLYAIWGILAITALIFAFGLGWHAPEAVESGGATAGLRISLEYAAGVTGLVFYTGAFIAEIVRGGIQSVSKGQWEAARSLGLPAGIAMRQVVFPQALRVIIPPLNSEYMNLAKNTTLVFAIGYPELYSVSATTFNQTGRPVEIILIIMVSYLIFNLLISVSMNQFNALVQLKER